MKKLTKKQRAEIFQFLYELHQKLWGEMIDRVRWGGKCDIHTHKYEIVIIKYGLYIRSLCVGCECNNYENCNCFLNLDCCGFGSLWLFLNKLMFVDKVDIYTMRKIQNCGWKDNGLSDRELIDVLLKL